MGNSRFTLTKLLWVELEMKPESVLRTPIEQIELLYQFQIVRHLSTFHRTPENSRLLLLFPSISIANCISITNKMTDD